MPAGEVKSEVKIERAPPASPRGVDVSRTGAYSPLAPTAPAELPGGPGARYRRRPRPWWRIPVPWTLSFYIIVEIFRVFVLAVVAVSLVYTVVAAYQTVRSGLQLGFIWPLLAKTFAYPLYYSIPISFLFGVTLALGRMANDLEIAALRTHGVSHVQMFIPVAVLSVLLCALSIHLNGWVVPEIHYEKRNLQAYILEQLESLGSGENRTLLLPDGAGTLWVGAYDGTRLWRVDIDLHLGDNSQLLGEIRGRLPQRLPSRIKILAREGSLELLPDRTAVILDLRGVDVLIPEALRGATVANERFHQRLSISESVVIPLSFAPKSPGIKDRTQPELSRHISALEDEVRHLRMLERHNLAYATHASDEEVSARRQKESRLAGARTEFHRRLAFSFSCLTFPVLGVALTFLLQRWNRLVPFFAANLVVIGLFYPLLMVGVSLGKSGFLPFASLALPNLAVLALGVFLMRKVVRQ